MTGRPWPPLSRILESVQHVLMAAVSVVVAIIVIVAFTRVLQAGEDGDPVVPLTNETAQTVPPATTPLEAGPRDEVPASTTTTVVAASECDRTEPAPRSGVMVLRIFYSCGSVDRPAIDTWVYREVPQTTALLTTTMRQLVAGPSPDERDDGFSSAWSEATDGVISSVQLSNGEVIVEFGRLDALPAVSGSPSRDFFLAALNASLFQYDRVSSVEYRIQGSCDDFWALLGAAECEIVTRAEWDAQAADYQAAG